MSESFAKLQGMTDEELIAVHDFHATNASAGYLYYRDELSRREARRNELRILALTTQIRNLTIFVAVLTLANLFLVGIDVLRLH